MEADHNTASMNLAEWLLTKNEENDMLNILQQACSSFWDDNLKSWMTYGPDDPDSKFINALAKFLTEQYGDEVSRDHLWTSMGINHAIIFLCGLFVPAKSVAFVEDKACRTKTSLLEHLGFTVVEVPMDSNGISVVSFEALLKKHCSGEQQTDKYNSVAYFMPRLHNPTGITYTEDCCRDIVRLARRYNVLVLCDEEYSALLLPSMGENIPRRLFAYDNRNDTDYGQGHVISLGSFSLISPAIEIGWMELPLSVVEIVRESGENGSSGSFAHYYQGLFKGVFKSDQIYSHVRNIKSTYKDKIDKVHERLESRLPSGSKVLRPKGGFFLWVQLPDVDSEKLLQHCQRKYQLSFLPGSLFAKDGTCNNCLRLSVKNLSVDDLFIAIDKLVEGIQTIASGL